MNPEKIPQPNEKTDSKPVIKKNLQSAPASLNEIILSLDPGLHSFFQRTLRELTDVKKALDQVLVVAITDPNGVITYVNDRFCQLYKYSREEVIGQSHRLLKSGEHSREFYKNLWQTINSGQIFSGEIKNRAKDGSFHWAYMVIVPFLDEQGKPYQYVSFRTDITPMKDAQGDRIKRIKAEAEVHARDQFVSMVAHELKTPITSLQLVLELLVHLVKREHSPDEITKIRHLLERSLFQSKRLMTIINDLLDVSRIAAGKLRVTPQTMDLEEMLQNLLDNLQEDFEAAGCKVTLEIKNPAKGIWDKARLEQVMINLLTNAMKFGRYKPIHITLSRKNKTATIQVRDFGIGVSEEFKQKIFQRFERAETVAHFKGSGLGLWITRQIVEAHGGRIWVESQHGKGSTFIVELPIQNQT